MFGLNRSSRTRIARPVLARGSRLGSLVLSLSCALAPLSAQEPVRPAPDTAPNRILAMLEAERDRAARDAADEQAPKERREAMAARAARMAKVLESPKQFRAQVLLGEVVESEGKPTLQRTGWRADLEYFYPASTVKLFGAVAALERVNDYRRTIAPKFDENTPLGFHPLRRGDALLAFDADHLANGKITVAHAIRESFLISDNESFNRLYDFCGQDWINESATRAGFADVRISHRLSTSGGAQENRRTPIVELRTGEGTLLVESRIGTKDLSLSNVPDVFVGERHLKDGQKVSGAMSFIYKNRATLNDLMGALARVVRPDLTLPGTPFDLTDAQRAMLVETLKMNPGDSQDPRYERARYPDDYAKFFLNGLTPVIAKGELSLHSKSGLAYGFATDNAYIVDARTGRVFFLAATIYADSDGTINDNQYEYDSIGLPWLADVAEAVARGLLARGN